jgi:hypothetical protein
MTRFYSIAATALAFLVGCAHHPDDMIQPSGDPSSGPAPSTGTDPGTSDNPGPGSDAGSPAASCPIGTAAWAHAIGLATTDQRADIAVDAAGNVLLATLATRPENAGGLTKLSPSGEVLLGLPFGSVVATDRAGNAYLAGSFTAPLDVGLGVMQPEGNIDVFVAKLDAHGKVVFARPLRLCGDGVQSIAVDGTGRIAVSGTAMGTALLSPTGDLELVLALSGDVAFTSHGDLIIAGTFTTAIDLGDGPVSAGTSNSEGFVIKVDRSGQRIWSHLLTGSRVHLNGVAVDRKDNVVLAGFYESSIDLFGDRFTAISVPDSGRVTGSYVVELDADGEVIWKQGRAFGSEANGVATDLHDNAIIAGASTGNALFNRIIEVSRFDTAGAEGIVFSMSPGTGFGRGLSVATDSCGSIYTALDVLDQATVDSRVFRLYVVKSR